MQTVLVIFKLKSGLFINVTHIVSLVYYILLQPITKTATHQRGNKFLLGQKMNKMRSMW